MAPVTMRSQLSINLEPEEVQTTEAPPVLASQYFSPKARHIPSVPTLCEGREGGPEDGIVASAEAEAANTPDAETLDFKVWPQSFRDTMDLYSCSPPAASLSRPHSPGLPVIGADTRPVEGNSPFSSDVNSERQVLEREGCRKRGSQSADEERMSAPLLRHVDGVAERSLGFKFAEGHEARSHSSFQAGMGEHKSWREEQGQLLDPAELKREPFSSSSLAEWLDDPAEASRMDGTHIGTSSGRGLSTGASPRDARLRMVLKGAGGGGRGGGGGGGGEGEEAEYQLLEPPWGEHGLRGCSSVLQAVFNGLNVLAGVGVLSTPYALAQGGWMAGLLLVLLALVCCATGMMLRDCMEVTPGIHTYPDIGQLAFGLAGRRLISVLLYAELFLVTTEFLILEGDNLAHLFPHFSISVPGWGSLRPDQSFLVVATLCVLPTVHLRDLRLLSYVSALGVASTVAVVLAVVWVGEVEGVGFHNRGEVLRVSGLPVASGLFGFCYSAHAVFPNIYASMADRRHFTTVLVVSFSLCTVIYGGIAVAGYLMFGSALQSQITLNLPPHLPATKVAVWTTVFTPFAKYALTITPVASALEELLPFPIHSASYSQASAVIRTLLVLATATVGLTVPFFGFVMAFIGSFLSMTISVVLPAACFLKIKGARLGVALRVVCVLIIAVGLVFTVTGTYASIASLVGRQGAVRTLSTYGPVDQSRR